MEQQLSRRAVEQRRGGERERPGGTLRPRRPVERIDRRPGDALRHQPDRPLGDGIAEIGRAHLRLVIARPVPDRRRACIAAMKQRPRGLPRGLAAEPEFHDRLPINSPSLQGRGRGWVRRRRPKHRVREEVSLRSPTHPQPPPFGGGGSPSQNIVIRGSARLLPSISSVIAQTIASARSGDRPGPS